MTGAHLGGEHEPKAPVVSLRTDLDEGRKVVDAGGLRDDGEEGGEVVDHAHLDLVEVFEEDVED